MRFGVTSTTVRRCSHRAVVLRPVIVRSAGRLEHLAQQQPQALGVDVEVRIVWTDQLGVAFDSSPTSNPLER